VPHRWAKQTVVDFREFDKDISGTLNKHEVIAMLKAKSYTVPRKYVNQTSFENVLRVALNFVDWTTFRYIDDVWATFDRDRSGSLEIREFAAFEAHILKMQPGACRPTLYAVILLLSDPHDERRNGVSQPATSGTTDHQQTPETIADEKLLLGTLRHPSK
jgi:Ca2+-binding EF-hand superfamily protein